MIVWNRLDRSRKFVVSASTVGAFLALVLLARSAISPEMVLLFGGLEPQAAVQVIDKLNEQGIHHSVKGGSVLVPKDVRDSLRLQLAGQESFSGHVEGYEILDNISGFGTTSQMFDAAYWRAKEGELARTIYTSPQVKNVRVHIANSSRGRFGSGDDASASVMIEPAANGLKPELARSLRTLVASAVEGLRSENVVIVNAISGEIFERPELGSSSGRRGVLREKEIRNNVERILRARLGEGNFAVELSLETVKDSEKIRERLLDPSSRIAVSTEVMEVESAKNASGSDAVTVASNLPDAPPKADKGRSEVQQSETHTITNFELSETVREIDRPAGSVRRITAAVLLNRSALVEKVQEGEATLGNPGQDLDTEISDITDLVSAAIGFDGGRGDVLSVKALTFQPKGQLGSPPEIKSFLEILSANAVALAQSALLAIVLIVIAIFVLRPLLRYDYSGTIRRDEDMVIGDEAGTTSEHPKLVHADASQIGADHRNFGSATLERAELASLVENHVNEEGSIDVRNERSIEAVPEELRGLAQNNQTSILEILRSWLLDDAQRESAR